MNAKPSSRRFFDSAKVTSTVGIPSRYLNKFIERRRYGIEPSVQAGEGRGSRRFFSEDDIYGIALVWWLFEGGLRSDAIQDVFNEICRGKKKATASEAALVLRESDADILVVKRQPRIGLSRGKAQRKLEVILEISELGFRHLVETLDTESLLYIPFSNLIQNLKDSMQKHGLSVEIS